MYTRSYLNIYLLSNLGALMIIITLLIKTINYFNLYFILVALKKIIITYIKLIFLQKDNIGKKMTL